MKKNEISHSGKVVAVGPGFVTVEIVSESACSACHAAGLCGMSEFKTKAVEVPSGYSEKYEVGETVEVVLKASMGLKAVWISYVVPLVILMILILSLSVVHVHELVCGLAGIAGVGLYYFLIWLFRDRLADEYVFVIRKL